MPDFIPPKDADLDAWAINFETRTDTEYATFGLTSGQATAFGVLQAAFTAALLLATDPATRTSVTIANKDSARAALVANARELAKIVKAYPGVTNGQLIELGLTPYGNGPTPIPAPTTKPLPAVVSTVPLGHVLQIRDVSTPDSRAKPAGATACEVYSKVGTTPPASLADCVFRGLYTKPFMTVNYGGADAGDQAYYMTRWVTRRGLTGPTSDVIAATIPAA